VLFLAPAGVREGDPFGFSWLAAGFRPKAPLTRVG
jgi:hypothetical protein